MNQLFFRSVVSSNWGDWHNYNDIGFSALPLSKYFHVAFTYDGNASKAYLNGEIYKTRVDAGGYVGNNGQPLIIGFGDWNSEVSRFFKGEMDDIRIYNRALSEVEIKQLYETTETKINQPPVAMFSSSNPSNTSTINVDASLSNDLDGTIQRYEWLSSDGQMKDSKTASFTFEKAGNYAITLTVTDDKGITSQAVKNVFIGIGGSCTNATITNCRASFSFETGKLCVPCVSVPTALGSQIYAAELNRINPLQLGFEVNPLTLKPHNFKDSCLAIYHNNGSLNIPCVVVNGTSYNVDFIQRPESLIFDVINAR